MAYLIDILDFEGPQWLTLDISATGGPDVDVYLHFNSKVTPSSITIANRSTILINLKEASVYPSRLMKEGFLANVSAFPIAGPGIV